MKVLKHAFNALKETGGVLTDLFKYFFGGWKIGGGRHDSATNDPMNPSSAHYQSNIVNDPSRQINK